MEVFLGFSGIQKQNVTVSPSRFLQKGQLLLGALADLFWGHGVAWSALSHRTTISRRLVSGTEDESQNRQGHVRGKYKSPGRRGHHHGSVEKLSVPNVQTWPHAADFNFTSKRWAEAGHRGPPEV